MSSTLEMKKHGSGTLSKLMRINGLSYDEPADVSVIKSRSIVESQFSKSVYENTQTATCFINFSDGFIDPKNSVLQFEIEVQNGTEAPEGKQVLLAGSALDVIRRVTLTSRSGEVIDSCSELGRLMQNVIPWQSNYTSERHIDSMFGRSYGDNNVSNDVSSLVGKSLRTFCIPLKYVLPGVFNPHNGALLCAKLMAGAKLSIEWSDNHTAFTHELDASGLSNTYRIKNPVLKLDTCILSDGALSALNKKAASESGIPLSFDAWHVVKVTSGSGTNSNVNVSARKAMSRAKKACLIISDVPANAAARTTSNLLGQTTNKWSSGQYRLGNRFYPHATLQLDDSQTPNFYNNCYVWGILDSDKQTTLDKYAAEGSIPKRNNPFSATFESSTISDYSGQQVSSGRSIDFTGKLQSASEWEAYLFVQYCVRIRVFSTKISILE